MGWFLFSLTFVAVLDAAMIVPLRSFVGRLLVTIRPDESWTDHAAFVVAEGQVVPAPPPHRGKFERIDWGGNQNEVLVTGCDDSDPRGRRCHLERLTLRGDLLQSFPEPYGADFIEEDGRVTPGDVTGPARYSSDGKILATRAYGRFPTFLDASTGRYLSGRYGGSEDYAWSPEGHVLVYAHSPSVNLGAFQSTQLFVLDFDTRQERQITFLADVDIRPWWKFWSGPMVRHSIVTGVSWARQANQVYFFERYSGRAYRWDPESSALTEAPEPKAKCWQETRLSSDGRSILYMSSDSSRRCESGLFDEIKVDTLDGSSSDTIIHVIEGIGIKDLDWLSE